MAPRVFVVFPAAWFVDESERKWLFTCRPVTRIMVSGPLESNWSLWNLGNVISH
jgi:hypothetical protein